MERKLTTVPSSHYSTAWDSIRGHQDKFAQHELPTLYGKEDAGKMLKVYFDRYRAQGFSTHVAVDDCSISAFGAAILILPETRPGLGLPSSAPTVPSSERADPPIVTDCDWLVPEVSRQPVGFLLP